MITYHSISDNKTDCEECEQENSLTRLPSKFSLSKDKTKAKIGDVVKKSINEFNIELEEEKRKLQNEIWSADD